MEESMTYEQAMQQLEDMARQMESGQIGIDEMAERLREAQKLRKKSIGVTSRLVT